MDSPIKTVLCDSEDELDALVKQRQKLDDRINKLIPTIRSLTNMLDVDLERMQHTARLQETVAMLRKPGPSQMIMNVLFAYPKGLTPIEIRNALVSSGALDPKEYVNPSATIHTTLRRLIEAGDVETTKKGGKKIFKIAARPGSPGVPLLNAAELREQQKHRKHK